MQVDLWGRMYYFGRCMNSKIVLVSGKGGVGKTTVASCLAQKWANQGLKVLLVRLSRVYEQESLEPCQKKLFPEAEPFEEVCWVGLGCLQEYVTHIVKSSRVSRLFFENSTVRRLLEVAPGLNELSILGKLTSGLRHVGKPFAYDKIVVDSYATGHTLSLLKAPVAMKDFFTQGAIKNPMGEQSSEILEVLKDEKLFCVSLVTRPEEFALQEALEFSKELETLNLQCFYSLNQMWPNFLGEFDSAQGFYHQRVQAQEQALSEFMKLTQGKEINQWPFIPYDSREDLFRHLLEGES